MKQPTGNAIIQTILGVALLVLGLAVIVLGLKAMLALYFAYYNFCRIHSSIRCTPAMESGLTGHVWSIQELLTA